MTTPLIMAQSPNLELIEGLEMMNKAADKMTKTLESDSDFGTPFSSSEYMELYSIGYNLCTKRARPHQYPKELYEEYRAIFERYISDTVLPSIEGKHSLGGSISMLSEIVKRWANHKLMVKWLVRIFFYVERYYTQKYQLPTLKEVGINFFRGLVFEKVKREAVKSVVSLIDRERHGELQIDSTLLKGASDLFVDMGGSDSPTSMEYYEKDFEPFILEDAAAFYSPKASTWIVQYTCPEYLIKAEEYLNLEKERAVNYLHSTTEPKLLERVRKELLAAHVDELLNKEQSGLVFLLREDRLEDLSRMYKLFSKMTNGLEPLSKIFLDRITSEGTDLVNRAADWKDHTFIKKVIELHDKYMLHVTQCFENQTIFHKALKEAFEVFCNKKVGGNTSAELLALFIDSILQKSGSDIDVVELTLDKAVMLASYISDIDLFFEFCRKKLARRLLFDRSASEDLEKSLLSKLKQHYGGQFTSKMECMILDLTLSREKNGDFKNYLTENRAANQSTAFSVNVLTSGMWPTNKPSELILPTEMVKYVEKFSEYYYSTTNCRKLTWVHSLGSCTLTGMFKNKTMEIIVSTYQASTLLLFNDSDKLSYSEIKTQLNLSDEDVARVLHSLSCAKYKILKKVPGTKSLSPNDYFEFNYEFTDKMRRIKIPLPPADDKKKVIETVTNDRKFSMEACIVRIMKSRKVLPYQQLLSECVEQLSRVFKPEVKLIKVRIEDLISREFLERDATNPTVVKYLA